jgi:DNA (cytosine-5)-methyltransferase 1
MRLLDLFCGAGGAAVGYRRAGFDVVGVDHVAQPRYPFEFHQADALTFPLDGFDVIHASPPCHAYSTVTGRNRRKYPDLVADTRHRLFASRLPYVIENVEGAPLLAPFRLCGSSFGLDLRRHRLFEPGRWHPVLVPPCAHHWQARRYRSLNHRRGDLLASVVGVHGHLNYAGEQVLREQAMGIEWMTPHELTQAIPPAYTEWLGAQLMAHLEGRAA